MNSALIGYGYWGKIIEKYINLSSEFSLMSIYDSKMHDANVYIDILKDPNIECIFICTPVATHYDVVKQGLLSGKHIFCEKPLSLSSNEVTELEILAKGKKKNLYVNYIYTVSQSINYIKSNLYKIGKIRSISAAIRQFGNFYADADVYSVIGVHMISSIAHILDCFEPKKYEAIKTDICSGANSLAGIITVHAQGDIICVIDCSLISPRRVRRMEILGEHGIFVFDMMAESSVEQILFEKTETSLGIKEPFKKHFDESNNLSLALNQFYGAIIANNYDNCKISTLATCLLEVIAGSNKNVRSVYDVRL